jgi:hypothetical protein
MAGNVALVAFNAHLQQFQFTQNVQDALNEQGITLYTSLHNIYNRKQGFENLWKRLADLGGMTRTIKDHDQHPKFERVAMTLREQTRLIELAYWVRHRYRIQRPMSANISTLAKMRNMGEMMNQEKELREPSKLSTLPPVYNNKVNIRRVMDAIEGYLSQQIGSLGVPLTYVIREDEDVDNTVIYGPDEVFEEIVARCRHTGVPFQTDNARVWTAIRHVFFTTDGQAWVEEHQARQDGRGAWLSLQQRYVGDRAREFNAEEAEAELRTRYYNGKSARHTFKSFVDMHKRCHQIIKRDGEVELTGRQKVHYLIRGCKAVWLTNQKEHISFNTDLHADFDAAVAILTAKVAQHLRYDEGTRQIAGLGTQEGGRGGRGEPGRGRG